MLKPAICYKEEIEDALKQYFYTPEMMFYRGGLDNRLIEIQEGNDGDKYQYAVVDSDEGNLIGYIAYSIDFYSSCAYNFGAFSFDRGNPVMGKELYTLMEGLIQKYHKVEFRAVSGNPAIKGYDRFFQKHKDIGARHVLRDDFKDAEGRYHDVIIYEFINPENE